MDRSALHNEIVTIKEGLLAARNKGIQRIHIECDAESLITMLNTKITPPWMITNILRDIVRLLQHFSEYI